MNKILAIEFDKMESQLDSICSEIDKLSKKKPDDTINSYKLNIINCLLGEINELFEKGDIPIEKFKLFDETELPSYSDIVLVFSQYLEKMDYFRFRNTFYKYPSQYWRLEDEEKLETKPPKYGKLK